MGVIVFILSLLLFFRGGDVFVCDFSHDLENRERIS